MKIMEKKNYIAPTMRNLVCESEDVIADSRFDYDSTNPDAPKSLTPTDTEYNGEFGSRSYGLWDEE